MERLLPKRELPGSIPCDKDRILPLVAEVVAEGHSVLLFCAGRSPAEACASLIAAHLPQLVTVDQGMAEVMEERQRLLAQLQEDMGGYKNELLEKLICEWGFTWHTLDL
jgi:replicative superfamily II helicase